jgi:U4/U6 small nuclear ribonucleoprotein PRP4
MAHQLMGADAIAAGRASGNINDPLAGEREKMALSSTSQDAQEQHAVLLLRLEAQRRIRTVDAPTDVEAVKVRLRTLGHPITLFGEGPADRRLRLQTLLAEAEVAAAVAAEGLAAVTSAAVAAAGGEAASAASVAALAAGGTRAVAALSAAAPKPELFYTPGGEALAACRARVAAFSFARAAARLLAEAAAACGGSGSGVGVMSDGGAAASAEDAAAGALLRSARAARPLLSISADERPLSCCALAPDGSVVASGSWGPVVRLFDPGTARPLAALKGHRDRVVGLAWHPCAGAGRLHAASAAAVRGLPVGDGPPEGATPATAGLLASASVDGTARLWRVPVDALRSGGGAAAQAQLLEEGVREVACLKGHKGRLCSVAFHPSGEVFATTGFDRTWRLWDVETAQELLAQEVRGAQAGAPPPPPHLPFHPRAFLSRTHPSHNARAQGHAREVYPVAFHPDGSLVATGDLSGLGRVWDLRSGKSIFLLRGHATQLLALDWSPNGYHVASGSEDCSSIIWELRQQRVLYTIPAHSGMVSRVRFSPASGEVLATASYDGTAKLWCARDWSPLAVLRAHEGKVTGLDVFGRGGEAFVVTAGWDRTVKVCGPES